MQFFLIFSPFVLLNFFLLLSFFFAKNEWQTGVVRFVKAIVTRRFTSALRGQNVNRRSSHLCRVSSLLTGRWTGFRQRPETSSFFVSVRLPLQAATLLPLLCRFVPVQKPCFTEHKKFLVICTGNFAVIRERKSGAPGEPRRAPYLQGESCGDRRANVIVSYH